MFILGLSLLSIAVFCAVWYCFALRHHRRRALDVLRWIEFALDGQGQPTGMRWIAQSRFKVPLRLTCGIFHRAWLVVDLTPSEMPLRWLFSKVSGQQEMLTFQADLDLPPAFTLEVHSLRWFARTNLRPPADRGGWRFEHTGPFVITTRTDWKKEISSAMGSLARSVNHDLLDVSFQRRSPHFSATLPLATIAPGSPIRGCMFETMRELAARSSASLS
jgi:hypothetical protein